MPWVAIAAAAAGAVAGGQKDKSQTVSGGSSSDTIQLQDFSQLSKGQSGLEALSYQGQLGGYQDLMNLVAAGPGQNEITANTNFQNTYANQLQGFLNQIGNNDPRIQQQNYNTAKGLFAPQQTALNQQFYDQGIQANRLAAKLGRAGNDPIMRNKLMQEQTRQQTMLNSQIGSYGMQLPQIQAQQAIDIGGALSNVRQGLASQALNNRQTLLSMGQSLTQQERNYRLQAANRYHTQESDTSTYSGGGIKGALQGGLAGFGAGGGFGK